MVKFYKNEVDVVTFLDDTYQEENKLVVERPATDDDANAHPDEYTEFVAASAQASTPVAEPSPPVSHDGAA